MTDETGNLLAERYIGFDILKCICAFFIVCIHCPFPGITGQYFTALTRIAVPIFFMITGFFYRNTVIKEKEEKQIKKIFVLVVEANLLYFLWECFYTVISGSGICDYLILTLTEENFVKFLVLNESPFGSHLWYLGALLYVLLIVLAVNRWGNGGGSCYVLIPILLIGDLVLGKYSLFLLHREFPSIVVRNFLFVGIPYFFIGEWLSGNKRQYTINVLSAMVVLFSVTTLVERYLLVSLDLNSTRDHYISTTFLAIAVFLLFTEIYKVKKTSCIEDRMARIGRDCSTWIYIIHPIFIMVLSAVSRKTGIYEIYQLAAPIIVYMASAVFVRTGQMLIKTISRREERLVS